MWSNNGIHAYVITIYINASHEYHSNRINRLCLASPCLLCILFKPVRIHQMKFSTRQMWHRKREAGRPVEHCLLFFAQSKEACIFQRGIYIFQCTWADAHRWITPPHSPNKRLSVPPMPLLFFVKQHTPVFPPYMPEPSECSWSSQMCQAP